MTNMLERSKNMISYWGPEDVELTFDKGSFEGQTICFRGDFQDHKFQAYAIYGHVSQYYVYTDPLGHLCKIVIREVPSEDLAIMKQEINEYFATPSAEKEPFKVIFA